MAENVTLRPFRDADLALLDRHCTDPAFSAPFEWGGYQAPETYRRRWEDDGFLGHDPHYLVVAAPEAAGFVMWRDPRLFDREQLAWEIGILLAPEARGRGIGTAAQQLLVEHLFQTSSIHRLCAYTEVDNVAEQRSLERCGFAREGVLRQVGFRGGAWRDAVLYALLRTDPRPSTT
jgi:RimJ/RimL family protein N-acetyltransferase